MIRLNGKPAAREVSDIAALLRSLDIDQAAKGIAVALNGSVVPRRAWTDTPLADGDEVEVIRALQGG
jgi:sulfur carrier protein